MISYANKKGFITSMTTNGILLNKKYRDILDSGLRFITISIDGFEQGHDEMKGTPGAFNKTLYGLKKLVSARNNKIHIRVNVVINRMNYNYLFNLVKFIFSLNLD